MDSRLLVSAQVIAEVRILLQSLADARDAAVAENAPGSREKRRLAPVPLDELILQESDQGL